MEDGKLLEKFLNIDLGNYTEFIYFKRPSSMGCCRYVWGLHKNDTYN